MSMQWLAILYVTEENNGREREREEDLETTGTGHGRRRKSVDYTTAVV